MRLIVVLILSLSILSCGRTLLGPENIPPPTDFYIPPDTIPGNVDIDPIPAPDGSVFGGFGKRFIYKGKWHILVDNIYKYNPDTKTLTKRSSKSLIRLDDKNTITIIAENLDDIKVRYESGETRSESVWTMLNGNWNMNGANLTYEYTTSQTGSYYSINYNVSEGMTIYYSGGGYRENTYFLDYVRRNYYLNYIYTDDLINWYYKSEIKATQNIIELPRPKYVGGSGSWQHNYGIDEAVVVPFKSYIYILGGHRNWGEDNPGGRKKKEGPYSPMETTIKRISVNKALGRQTGWEEHGALFGERNIFLYSIKISSDGNKLFIRGNYKYKWKLDDPPGIGYSWYYSGVDLDDVWSTTDGIDWKRDSEANYNDAYGIDNQFTWNDVLPQTPLLYKEPLPIKPLEPDWAKNSQNFYYKMDKTTNSIPIPHEEIRAAADRGETNFVVTEEHKNSYNNFLISGIHPDEADEYDWKALKINNYTKSSMHWVSSTDYLFAFGDKLVRFVDYDNVDEYFENTASQKAYEEALKISKMWYERGNNGGYDTYTKKDCYYQAMIYKAQADVMSAVLHADEKDVLPDEAVSHYVLEFYH